MKRAWTNSFSLGAIGASLAALSCCLPPAMLGAAGFAILASVPSVLQPWLLVVSIGFLIVAIFALVRGSRCGVKPSAWNWALLAVAALLVILAVLFPQAVAGFIADYFY